MAKLLLFQCRQAEAEIRRIAEQMRVRVSVVPQEKFHLSLGQLANGLWDYGVFGGAYPQESMIVMCDFTENQMDKLLAKLREKKVPVDYKAVLTPTNRNWDVLHLYFEMARERAMYEQMKRDRERKRR